MMGMDDTVPCADITILTGASVSGICRAKLQYFDALSINLMGDPSLDGHTFVIEVTHDPDAVSPIWFRLQEGNPVQDVAVPAASRALTYYDLCGYRGFRIKDTTGTVSGDRVFKMDKKVRL